MRRILIGLAGLALVLAGATATLWVNRVPIAEWAIATYQPETPLGAISVRIRDITPSAIVLSEIRAELRGPITIQDVTVAVELGDDWRITLPDVNIGSVNAALSFADWADLLDALAGENPDASAGIAIPALPLSIGSVTVETIDLYAETPKGYALLNGNLVFTGTADLARPDAVSRLADGLTGNLLLSAGAAGFPVNAVVAGGGATGAGSVVLAAHIDGRTVGMRAITPIRLEMMIAKPLPLLPNLPAGTYRADIGSDDLPFGMTLGYGIEPAPSLRTVSFTAFPFALDTPFGTAEAQATTAPINLDQESTDAAALPVRITGQLNLKDLPLPTGMTASLSGGFAVDKREKTVISLDKGFTLATDMTGSPLRDALPPAALDLIGGKATFQAKSSVTVEVGSIDGGTYVTGTGSMALESGAVSAALPSGFTLDTGPDNSLKIGAKSATAALFPKRAPKKSNFPATNLTLEDISASLALDGTAKARLRYRAETEQVQSTGALEIDRSGTGIAIALTEGDVTLPGSGLSIPFLAAKGRMTGDEIVIDATLETVMLGDLPALKRPLSLSGHAKLESYGVEFTASGSVDSAFAVTAKGTYTDGDVVMTFGTGDIPLGPNGVDLSELTGLIDLGRSDPNGSIRVDGELTYQNEAISGYADLKIAEVGSILADGTSISVFGTVTFDLSRPPATMSPATLTGSLTSDIVGTIPFKETFTLRETGEMEVQSLEAKFLGGTVTVSEGLASASAGSLVGRLDAEKLNLEALANLLQIEGLAGTGHLTGNLKFQVMEDAVIVEAGSLNAEEPGVLHYKGEALTAAAAGNENLTLLVQALEDFHYDVLTLGIDIPEFGEGNITLHLEGKNPKVLDGYPFDVTINLESEYGRLIKKFLELYQQMDVILQGVVR